ncbi:MAG: phosphatase PAP2 family protein [Bacteroidota bacterium]
MFEILKSADKELFLFLNGMHNSFFDFVMYWASNRFIWIPFYAVLLFLVIRTFQKKSVLVLVLIAAMITVSDQVSSSIVKNSVHRLRPCHNPEIESQVHLVNGECGGSFGYFSSHASNSFALAVFLILIFRKKANQAGVKQVAKPVVKISNLAVILFSYSGIVSYSRIYLGSHYPLDVITGIVFGTLLSFIFAKIFFRVTGNKM